MQGLGWGKTPEQLQMPAVWHGRVEEQALGCQQAPGHRQGKDDARARWISFQQSQRSIPGSASLGSSWMTSGEPQTHKSWGAGSGSVTAQC